MIKPLDIGLIRSEFPLLHQTMHKNTLVYLDNANTTQKPKAVITATEAYYSHQNANIHRSVYALSELATQLYENSRDKIQHLIQAKHRYEIIFVKGTTEGINLIASSLSHCHIQAGDEIIITAMEHHANIVPWQWVCQRMGAILQIIPINDKGELDLDTYMSLLTSRTRLVAVTHVSNVLGTINPVQKMIALAHAQQIPVLVDGAQGLPHMPVNVQQLDCDFYLFSSHKLYGPTGVGVVYGKEKWLEKMPPYQGGGNMISQVTFAKTTYQELPYKFEAGTANIAGVIGLGAAVDYLNQQQIAAISAHETQLLQYATDQLLDIEGLRIIGTAAEKAGIISFVLSGVHPHDVGTALDNEGIAVRVGHHCAMPLMAYFDIPATIRVSFGMYNTIEEIDLLKQALLKTQRLFNLCPH